MNFILHEILKNCILNTLNALIAKETIFRLRNVFITDINITNTYEKGPMLESNKNIKKKKKMKIWLKRICIFKLIFMFIHNHICMIFNCNIWKYRREYILVRLKDVLNIICLWIVNVSSHEMLMEIFMILK